MKSKWLKFNIMSKRTTLLYCDQEFVDEFKESWMKFQLETNTGVEAASLSADMPTPSTSSALKTPQPKRRKKTDDATEEDKDSESQRKQEAKVCVILSPTPAMLSTHTGSRSCLQSALPRGSRGRMLGSGHEGGQRRTT
jgi:hypothetical protein